VNAVAGWTPTSAAATGAPTAVTAPNCGTAALCDVAPFYFIAPGAYTFNFSYVRASDGQGSPEVPVTINVTGPTATGAGGAFLTATVQNPPARYDGVHSTTPLQIVNVWPGSPPYLRFGQNGDNPGIVFYVAAQPPAAAQAQAQFQFVQVITASKFSWLTSAAMNGVMRSLTSAVTMLPNAAPTTTPTARSTAFPRRINALNPLSIRKV